MTRLSSRTAPRPRDTASLWLEVSRLVHCRMVAAWKDTGTNPVQLFALFLVREYPGLTMKEFATHLHITAPSATAMADRLFALRWITRRADPANRKQIRLRISALGRRMLEAHMQDQEKAVLAILALLDPRDRRDAARILRNLHASLMVQH
jgi:DNA-binding MarR family transcriptional regulator